MSPSSAKLQQRLSDSFATPVSTTRVAEPGTPEWWRHALLTELYYRRTYYDTYEAYYDGQHRLAFATEKFREAFGTLFAAFADNWCDLVVDASVERLRVEGFRFGQRSGKRLIPTTTSFDSDAWDIWQANGLDAESDLAHTESVKLGEAYLLVTPNDEAGEPPLIQVEHPGGAIVQVNPARPRERLAGLRVFVDLKERVEKCVLYLPDEVYWWARPISAAGTRAGGWEPFTSSEAGESPTGRNPLGVVPLIPMRNRIHLKDRRGRSDISRVIPMQDAINKLVTDMIIASEFAAFRQRWVTGVEIPRGEDGQPVETFKSAVSRVWATEKPDVKFGEFTASDLSNYVTAVESLIQHVAAQTRTPPHYLLGSSGNFPSGESLKATETGLVAKVKRKQLWFGDAWEDALRLAFQIKGDKRADAQDAETIWADPESRSQAELTDSLVKMASLHVPDEALWARWGAQPQEIEDWTKLKANAAEAALSAPETIRATEQITPQGTTPATGTVPAPAPSGAKPPQPGDPAAKPPVPPAR